LKEDRLEIEKRLRQSRAGWDLSRLITAVCHCFDVEVSRITCKGRQNNLAVARGVICYLGTRELGISASAISSALKISPSAVPRSCERERAYCVERGLTVDDLS